MKWEQVAKIAGELPEVTESTWFGTPSLKVRGKGFVRLKDEDTVVFMLDSVDDQEFLMKVEPDVYFITDHYRGWPAVWRGYPRCARPAREYGSRRRGA